MSRHNDADVQELADVIRREVRLSAGIEEGQEFRCDWTRVAESVLAAVPERGSPSEEGQP